MAASGPFRCLPVPCPEDLLVEDLVDGLLSLEDELKDQREEEESVLDGVLSLEEESRLRWGPVGEEAPPRGETHRDRQRRAEEKRKRKREREKEEEKQIAEFLKRKREKEAWRRRRAEEKAADRARRKLEEEERRERKWRQTEQGAKQRSARKEKMTELGVDGYARQLESEAESLEAERGRLLQENDDLMGEVNYWQRRLEAMWSQ
uniref:Isoform HBZ-SI of HTLV-1 basic zipper factor n=1 Tax=Human T-cell leukemia virus 1 (isolate Melanesia mel5 subtype C) TaxID=402046 RepID=P0C747-2